MSALPASAAAPSTAPHTNTHLGNNDHSNYDHSNYAGSPLRITPIPGPRMHPAPLPGQMLTVDTSRQRFVQDSLRFDNSQAADEPTSPSLPDPTPHARAMAQGVVEVLAGRRAAVQLVRWASPEVYAALTTRASVAHRRRLGRDATAARLAVRRVVVTQPTEGVAEVAVVVIDGVRVRAIAMQLRARQGRWIIQALQVG